MAVNVLKVKNYPKSMSFYVLIDLEVCQQKHFYHSAAILTGIVLPIRSSNPAYNNPARSFPSVHYRTTTLKHD